MNVISVDPVHLLAFMATARWVGLPICFISGKRGVQWYRETGSGWVHRPKHIQTFSSGKEISKENILAIALLLEKPVYQLGNSLASIPA